MLLLQPSCNPSLQMHLQVLPEIEFERQLKFSIRTNTKLGNDKLPSQGRIQTLYIIIGS